jgi:hypothetical protein
MARPLVRIGRGAGRRRLDLRRPRQRNDRRRSRNRVDHDRPRRNRAAAVPGGGIERREGAGERRETASTRERPTAPTSASPLAPAAPVRGGRPRRLTPFAAFRAGRLSSWAHICQAHELRHALLYNKGQYTRAYGLELPAQPLDAAARATCLLPGALERVVPVSRALLDEQNETRAAREDVTSDMPAKRAAYVVRGESFAAARESGHPPVRLLAEHEVDQTRDLTSMNRGPGLRAPRIAGW